MKNFREEAENYIEYGITTLKEILADCKEIARTDKEAEVVDGKKIKANTWYKLENGEFVEVKETP